MASVIIVMMQGFNSLHKQDEGDLHELRTLQRRHAFCIPVKTQRTRFYFKIECPPDALVTQASGILDTLLADKADFVPTTAHLDEVVCARKEQADRKQVLLANAGSGGGYSP